MNYLIKKSSHNDGVYYFLKELDKDRNEKGCEYAVLVSLLEPENELYNSGIVDVFHRAICRILGTSFFGTLYAKRPRFFTLLCLFKSFYFLDAGPSCFGKFISSLYFLGNGRALFLSFNWLLVPTPIGE